MSNTYFFYGPDGTPYQALSFAYWTDLAQAFDGTGENRFNMLDAQGNNPPAPWVPFTRAGCNFGAVGTANIELERVANVATVYGAGSPEAIEAANTSDNGQAQTTADFIGVAVHCAKASALCASTNRGVADSLPAEPGGYVGVNGLFGHKYVAPQISSTLPMRDLDGNVIANVAPDGTAYPGFPGFNGTSAAVSSPTLHRCRNTACRSPRHISPPLTSRTTPASAPVTRSMSRTFATTTRPSASSSPGWPPTALTSRTPSS